MFRKITYTDKEDILGLVSIDNKNKVTAQDMNDIKNAINDNTTELDKIMVHLAGDTMTGALNFKANTWNKYGSNVAVGAINTAGTLAVKGLDGKTTIRLVPNGATDNNGVTWTANSATDSTISGTLNGSFKGPLEGNAATTTKLQTARTINDTSFNGTANITTAKWGTARDITLGLTKKSVNGSTNIAWTLAEIGALPAAGGTMTGDIKFSNVQTGMRGITGTVGDNDYWRVVGVSTASDAGYLEIATADGGDEPIYVRQYSFKDSNSFGTVTRTATILDASGNTTLPGLLTVNGIHSSKACTFDDNLTVKKNITGNGTLSIDGATTLKNTLSVTGASTFNNNSTFKKNATINGALNIDGSINSLLVTSTYLNGNNGKAIINSNAAAGAYVMLAKMNSTNGFFTTGVYQNKYLLQYTNKTTVAADTNTVDKSVTLLDEDGNATFPEKITAKEFAGKFTGNSSTATKLATARTISLTGSVTGSGTFDGSGNLSIATTTNHTHAYLPTAGGSMTGNINFNGRGNNYIGAGPRDGAGGVGEELNNLVISAWYGVSFTTLCDGDYKNKNAVSINTRTGHVYANTYHGALSGNASTATKLATARTINGTSFDGSGNITTANWGTARTLTIGNTGKSINGSGNVSWNLSEIGALPKIIGYYGSDNDNTAGWYKVCTISQSGYSDNSLNLLITQGFSRQATGILHVHTRCDNSTGIGIQSLKWMYRYGFNAGDVIVTTGNNTWSLYVYQSCIQYGRIQVKVISKSGTSGDTTFTLSNNNTKEASTPRGTAATDGGIVQFANTSAKATQDSAGQQINSTYIKGLSVSGRTITYTKGNGTTGTITTQDTTYPIKSMNINDSYTTKYRTQTKGNTASGDYITTIRNDTANVSNSPQYGSGLAWGRGDTHGYMYMSYSSPEAYVGGGNADKLNWVKKIGFAPITTNVIAYAGWWGGGAAPYTCTINIANVTASNVVEVGLASNANDDQVKACMKASIAKITQANGSITLYAYGTKPTVDIPLSIVIMEN